MFKRIVLLVLLIATPCWAQINVPAETEPHAPIAATLANPIPEGAQVQGGWTLATAKFLPVPDGIHVWAPPGVHEISYRGVWIKTVPVTLPDGTVVQVLQGFGFLDETATFKVTGGGPDPGPDPPDPPTPGGKYQLVFWYTEQQLDNLPQGQRDILTSLVFRDWLRSQGHVLVEVLDPANFGAVVPDKWKPWVNSILNQPLPRISLSPVEGGQVTSYQLPADMEACKKLLAAPGRKR